MNYRPNSHWRHKFVDAQAWVDHKLAGVWVVSLKLGRNEFAQVKTHQIDRLMKDFEPAPLDMGD